MSNFAKDLLYATVVIVLPVIAGTQGYKKGYGQGQEDTDKSWQTRLIDADYAEFDRKNGNWKLRSMEDVLMAGSILGRAKPDGWFPEPEVDVKEVKETLKQKLKGKVKKS